ncbi:DUF559 domain-containing protein [Nostoc sp. FACHB-892]|uniref:endonuclease domain-containing protein n=1 Tax=Nostoc sp. FACHB-892 TaxID=2692843 RepID=UPI0016892544|nr:DUF559 domain-containing protein [Nostoc sp. FACHB-892]MBD2731990.1 DUF559 domain-containing protein [Nostoc sp. FACHB-892]
MPRTTQKPVFNPAGTEQSNSNSSLVSVAPSLPYYVEVRTSSLKNFLQKFYDFADKDAIQAWLEARQRTGFYFEINQHLHLAFADQRDGKGSEYWWFIYYNNTERKRIFQNIRFEEHLVRTRLINNQIKEQLTWNGLTLRSETEKKIATALYSRDIIFFANVNGFMSVNGLAITNQDNRLREKAEVDFLVFHNQKCMILEVDGDHHNAGSQRGWDYKRDRVFLRQGITTVRFPSGQCYHNTSAVIDEFLTLFN